MSLPANTVWEVRTATGSSTNGGGFVFGGSGTDYSQQTSPQYALTGLISSGSGPTILSSAAASDMVDNIAWCSGTNITTGWYRVISVSVGVSITFDSNLATGVASGVTVNVGGAFDTLGTAFTAAVQNNLIWCKGTEVRTSTLVFTLTYNGSGGAVNRECFTIRGYGTTRGDGGRYTLTTATNSTDLFEFAGSQLKIENMLMSCTAGTPGVGLNCGTSTWYLDLLLYNVRITGFNENIRSPYSSQIAIVPLTLISCEIDHALTYGIETVASIHTYNCWIHDNATAGLYTHGGAAPAQSGFQCIRTNFKGNGKGISHFTAASEESGCSGHILNCVFDGNTNGYDFETNNAVTLTIINSIFTGNVTDLTAGGGQTMIGKFLNNAFYNNTNTHNNFPTDASDITLTADPFNRATAGDYSLNSTSGGGALCKAAGF